MERRRTPPARKRPTSATASNDSTSKDNATVTPRSKKTKTSVQTPSPASASKSNSSTPKTPVSASKAASKATTSNSSSSSSSKKATPVTRRRSTGSGLTGDVPASSILALFEEQVVQKKASQQIQHSTRRTSNARRDSHEAEESLDDAEDEVVKKNVKPIARSGRRKAAPTVEVMSDGHDEEDEEDDEADDDDDDEEDEEEEIPAPVVFQCGTCRSIFGDSYAFVCSNAELLLVTLSAVANIAVSDTPKTSMSGMDLGSSYHELVCKQCQTVLGRRYLTTPMPLDAIRNLYSFATTEISSYQLGFPQLSEQQQANDIEGMKQATVACVEAMQRLAHERQDVNRLQDDMKKVQNLLLVVDERLHELETRELDSEDDEQTREEDTAHSAHGCSRTPER
ncbi:TPA: hypothetical protein N0F65_000911 [Lagenidium giganteum]|uniref:Mis18 domain-containing protein n=1 Tax=Lagenidium giganteum TaxID=4803 RepID=A0AAV2YLZ9_9STRA|nr:TPA: hypothetical protein N0F65_000911 [Lagenidium giganteum]